MRRQRVGDEVWNGYIIELYRLVVYEVLDAVLQIVTFLEGMPFGPKMVFTLLGRVEIRCWKAFSRLVKY